MEAEIFIPNPPKADFFFAISACLSFSCVTMEWEDRKLFLFAHVTKTLVRVQGLLRHLLMVSCTCCRILRCVKIGGFFLASLSVR